MTLKTGTQSTI